ncbi:AMP-binding protein [Krasilnikoviella flava]|uniref:O-succinylbenzoic acid--CoA ligase n=1 Tax=Krasilnikoviella flava TaxID=526729 RepID=A0A1T5J5Z3_9MICO|nr:AMP-binding protein [Krasilnikoviella flava]SKC46967.1 O-succinylbenzoic acid--CoA ligase [Krasilnikoviella flava]
MPGPSLPPPVGALRDAVRDALDGGTVVVPLPRTTAAPVPAGTALVVRTSGSTGTPREVALTAAALRASATATHERLGGPGRWVLTLPPTHVAGLQVVVRSALAGTPLTAADPDARFTPDGLADLLEPALDAAGGDPVYVSLVPTQVHRLLAAAHEGASRGLAALARCAAVLLGGAASPPALLERAADAGVHVVTTYGMSETAGGCVYDGAPLRGVRVRVVPADLSEPQRGIARPGSDNSRPPELSEAQRGMARRGSDDSGEVGVIELGGPTLAAGYLGDDAATAAAFRTDADGSRWFRTSDLGRLRADGTLQVLGRADDVVVTGGVNVAPAPVEALVGELLGGEACVVGVPDPEWGQALVAVVADPASGGARLSPVDGDDVARVRAAATTRLGAPSAPRRVYRTAALPLRGPGKVDRGGVVALVREHEAHA